MDAPSGGFDTNLANLSNLDLASYQECEEQDIEMLAEDEGKEEESIE